MSAHTRESGDFTDTKQEIHATGAWSLVVRVDGAVEARTHWDNGDLRRFTTAPVAEAPASGARYRYGLSIEQVLARYAHETRFKRDPNDGEHGAAFRDGIIKALCNLAPSTFLDERKRQPIGVIHVNAPTGPSTYVVSEDTSENEDYATFYPFVGIE